MNSVIVLFPKIEVAKNIRNLLVRNGILVIAVCTTGAQVITAIDELDEGLVICGYKYVDMMYHELREYLPDTFEMLLVVSKTYWADCVGNDVVCLSMPIQSNDLINTVNLMLETILRKKKKRKQKSKIRSEEEKAVIMDAKSMLMETRGMTEDEAHKYLQRKSMDSGTNLVEMSQIVLDIF